MKAKLHSSLFWIFFIEMAFFVKKDCAKTGFIKFGDSKINASTLSETLFPYLLQMT
jgi:hypothetical protein